MAIPTHRRHAAARANGQYAALNKVAASYAANAFAVSLNNGAVVTDTSGTLPTVTRMDLNALDGHITRMRYSRRRANDGTLRSLTT